MAQRLHQFDYLTELTEWERSLLDIPDDATVMNITDKFREGGPIVVSYTRPRSEEEKQATRRQLQAAIDQAIDAVVMQYRQERERMNMP